MINMIRKKITSRKFQALLVSMGIFLFILAVMKGHTIYHGVPLHYGLDLALAILPRYDWSTVLCLVMSITFLSIASVGMFMKLPNLVQKDKPYAVVGDSDAF